MSEKIKKIIKILFSREMITYLIAGVLTTLVNFAATYLFFDICGLDENLTTAIAWLVAVSFAYVINNYWVFLAGNEGQGKELAKIGKFFLSRLFTYVVEALGIYVFVTYLEYPMWPVKIVLMVVVIVLNYVFSKLLVFNSKNKKP